MTHAHDHSAATGAGHSKRLAAVLTITASVLIADVVGAIITGSLALLADAGHMLTDAAGLTIARW
jgi:cobalt-zinc-cadmium efflux system protein